MPGCAPRHGEALWRHRTQRLPTRLRPPRGALYYHLGSAVGQERGNNSVVECDLAKVEVAGSNPVSRSNLRSRVRCP